MNLNNRNLIAPLFIDNDTNSFSYQLQSWQPKGIMILWHDRFTFVTSDKLHSKLYRPVKLQVHTPEVK